jgi:hypothetical protein
MTSIDFFLNAEFLSTATGLTAGTVTSGATTDDATLYDCKAGCNITLTTAQSLFQFQTDSLDMTDTASEDILYKINYTTSATPLTADFVTSTIMTANEITFDNATKNIPNDFLAYLALSLFGTSKGVDLFTNEVAIATSVQTQSVAAFDARLVALAGFGALTYGGVDTTGTTLTNSNPSRMVFDHIMVSQPSRFADISGYKIGETDWFKMPILAGDSINFVLSITSPNDKTIVGSSGTTIANRKYQIKMTVVA